MSKEIIYLAAPYSDPDPRVREFRFTQANKAAAVLIGNGHHVYSPISMGHPISLYGDVPTDWEFWKDFDLELLSRCGELCILWVPATFKSTGVIAEIKAAVMQDMRVSVIEPGDLDRTIHFDYLLGNALLNILSEKHTTGN